jgi:hypothetical protein
VNTIEGALVFAGIPLAVVGVVFGAVFSTTAKPPRDESKKTKSPDLADSTVDLVVYPRNFAGV